ncbi:MAG TPA: glycosyltransferase [Thermoleophilaceae bacterium]|nr:glycosyltransferase [Thermoleophilaceae bacterium]
MGEGLVISYSPLLGGAERILLDLVPSVAPRAVLACPPGPLAREAAAAGLEVRELRPRRLELRGSARDRLGAPLRLAGQGLELRPLIRSLGPRWIVAWSMRSALSAGLGRGRHGPPLLFQHNDFVPAGLAGRAVRDAARRADVVSALSHAIARDLDPQGRLGDRLLVSHPGVDLDRFAPQADARNGRDVLLLGAIVDWKQPRLALETVARIPQSRLLIAGGPLGEAGEALLDRLRARAEQPDLTGRVEFLGRLEDPRPALGRAALLLHCADREPFGMALVEALASRRAVVAPAAGGPLEIVDQSCGRLYPPGDVEAAARAVTELLEDRPLLARLASGARERAERTFGVDAARERFREALDRLDRLRGSR